MVLDACLLDGLKHLDKKVYTDRVVQNMGRAKTCLRHSSGHKNMPHPPPRQQTAPTPWITSRCGGLFFVSSASSQRGGRHIASHRYPSLPIATHRFPSGSITAPDPGKSRSSSHARRTRRTKHTQCTVVTSANTKPQETNPQHQVQDLRRKLQGRRPPQAGPKRSPGAGQRGAGQVAGTTQREAAAGYRLIRARGFPGPFFCPLRVKRL